MVESLIYSIEPLSSKITKLNTRVFIIIFFLLISVYRYRCCEGVYSIIFVEKKSKIFLITMNYNDL